MGDLASGGCRLYSVKYGLFVREAGEPAGRDGLVERDRIGQQVRRQRARVVPGLGGPVPTMFARLWRRPAMAVLRPARIRLTLPGRGCSRRPGQMVAGSRACAISSAAVECRDGLGCCTARSSLSSRCRGGALPDLLGSGRRSTFWVTTVVTFAVGYWEMDGDGPADRTTETRAATSYSLNGTGGGERQSADPGFLDYLFVAFTTSSAFAQQTRLCSPGGSRS